MIDQPAGAWRLQDTAPAGYAEFLRDIKTRVQTAQIRASLAVNKELVLLYWGIGRDILQRQQEQGWGTKVIDRLAADLRRELPEMTGLSPRNLKYMRSFAEAWPNEPIVQQLVAQLPWGHNVRLLEYTKTTEQRLWYARAAIEHGWSRNVLVLQIETKLYERQGKATTNFERILPAPQSDLARELLKDPYNFEFLTLQNDSVERDLEKGLLDHIQKFLLELGAGFAFVGRQHHFEIDNEDFYIDLLFYHYKLRCFVVIDLKTGKFKPEYAGKMSFYLAAVDNLMRHPDDARTIGLILCAVMPTENEPEQNNLIKPKSPLPDAVPAGYAEFLRDIKARVQTAQIRAALAVNKELVLLYWGIGRDILQRQQEQGWGTKVIDKLAADLRRDIPDMTGWSLRNLKYMRSFAEAWPNESIVQAPLAQLTWYHNIALVEKAFGSDQRLWYARAAIEHGFRSSFRGTCVI